MTRPAENTRLAEIDSRDYYGKGYEDVLDRVPSVNKAKLLLGWEPVTGFDEAVRKTVEAILRENGL